MVPHDLAPWSTDYGWFAAWTEQGVWAQPPRRGEVSTL